MPRSVDGIVASHNAASARVKRGLSPWAYTVNLSGTYHNEDLSFEERRNDICRRLKACDWWIQRNETFVDLVRELSETTDQDEFNEVFDYIYDEADANRVWIKTS